MAAFTLAQAKNLSQSKLTNYVIDEFRKSPLLDAMVFDDTVKPQGGSTMTYVYNRVKTMATAAGRELNTEYKPQQADTEQKTVNLKVFGGSFQIDRVIANYEKQVQDLVKFQLDQKTRAVRTLFQDWFINGDSSSDATAFDGLAKALKDSSTEVTLEGNALLQLDSAANVKANWQSFLYELRQVEKLLDGEPGVIAVNNDLFAVFQSVADLSTQFQQTKSELGTQIVKYGNATIMKLGDKPGTSTPIIPTDAAKGTTDMYLFRIGLDAVHGVTPEGTKEPKIFLPDMTRPGAVKTGEVEMVAAMALKATRSAAVLHGIQVAPATGA
ncbi:phage capsid protein [Blautia producta]|uniref:major capsid protein n=1 Tax=Blautia producta TaxID=33035 RepID=UPI00210CB624|nr:phage capsid protein [Blautia producta]MCQ5125880.1 phage capsid protein [Blautia producta]